MRSALITNPVIYLKNYLTMSPTERGRDLAHKLPDYFGEWSGLGEYGHETAPDEVFAKFVETNWHPYLYETEWPTWELVSYQGIVKNQWLVHFTHEAHSIAQYGFTHGVNDASTLGLTALMEHEEKTSGGYNFAYTPRVADSKTGRIYGDEAVLFKASGVSVYHYGDSEDQVIFWGDTATNIIPVVGGYDGWQVGENKHGEPVFTHDSLTRVAEWVEAHYDQYKSVLAAVVAQHMAAIRETWRT